MVLFPEPVEPISASVSPFFALKEIFLRIYSSASGYLNDTFLNSTSPINLVLPKNSPSVIFVLVSITSIIRSTDTLALGYITNIIASIKNAIITCIA